MKKLSRILVLGLLSMLIFSSMLWAEDRERDEEVGGTFVRLVEREVGERGYMGIVIKPHDRDDHVTVLIPRRQEELWQAARRLREGQEVGVSFVTEERYKWIKGLEDERREIIEERPEGRRRLNVRKEVFSFEGDPERRMPRRPEMREPRRPERRVFSKPERREPRRPERREPGRPEYLEQIHELKRILASNLNRMAREFRELRSHIEGLERELQRLREENERLKRELRGRPGSDREQEREIRIRIQREDIEQEERNRPRERGERRIRRDRPKSEREVALRQLEVMRIALKALREAERADAAELLTLAVRSREMMLERRRDEEAQRVRERAPKREQLVEILSMASRLWREFGHGDKSDIVGELAEQLSGSREQRIREQGEREVRRRRVERRELGLPEGLIGFRGVLVGRVLRKLDRGFVLKVERVDKVWESNKADRPEAAVGRELIINIREDDELSGRFLDTLRALETGQRVLVEAFHFEGNRLTVVEQLRKVE